MHRTTIFSTGAALVTVALSVGMIGGSPDEAESVHEAATRFGTGAMSFDTDSVLSLVRARADEPALEEFYGGEDAELLWVTADGAAPSADRLIAALGKVRAEAIDPDEIGAERVFEARDSVRSEDADPAALARTEIVFSRGFLRLARTLARGSAIRQETAVEWNLDRSTPPGSDALAHLGGTELSAVLDSLRPRYPAYDHTVDALARYRTRADTSDGWPRIDGDGVAEQGDSAGIVARVRGRLSAGMVPEERRLAESGDTLAAWMDEDLARAVALFQQRHGLKVDSIIGPVTLRAMNVPISERIAELALNLDRMRRMPSDLGERAVLVNIAGFELQVLENNRPVMEMATVVGEPEWRTNVFRDSIEHMIVNPYWHIPESIEEEETLPRAKNDPGYLARNNISVVPANRPFGEPIDRGSIDWSEVSIRDFPHDFRQEPGPNNAMGRVKFMLPNRYAIYLHDTPADHLFEKNFRAFSHGCVRVERPWEFARYLLRTASDFDAAGLSDVVESKERTRIELDDPVPVYITYLTTWVEEDGRVSFHQDLYHMDDIDVAETSAGVPEQDARQEKLP